MKLYENLNGVLIGREKRGYITYEYYCIPDQDFAGSPYWKRTLCAFPHGDNRGNLRADPIDECEIPSGIEKINEDVTVMFLDGAHGWRMTFKPGSMVKFV